MKLWFWGGVVLSMLFICSAQSRWLFSGISATVSHKTLVTNCFVIPGTLCYMLHKVTCNIRYVICCFGSCWNQVTPDWLSPDCSLTALEYICIKLSLVNFPLSCIWVPVETTRYFPQELVRPKAELKGSKYGSEIYQVDRNITLNELQCCSVNLNKELFANKLIFST